MHFIDKSSIVTAQGMQHYGKKTTSKYTSSNLQNHQSTIKQGKNEKNNMQQCRTGYARLSKG